MSVPAITVQPNISEQFVFRQWNANQQIPGLPIETFATSYNASAAQGAFQNGPIEVTFNQPIDAFSIQFQENCGVASSGGPCGTHSHRIVAANDSGRVLIDTLAGLASTIERTGMRRVTVFSDSLGLWVDGVTAQVVPGWYTLSFRPDSSCPPSGDKVLDSKQVRDAIYNSFANSGAPPNFTETGGDIYKMTDGTYKAFPRADPFASACSFSSISPANEPPLPAGADQRWAYFHSHAPEGSFVVGCMSNGIVSNGNAYNLPTGGLSPADWRTASSQGFYVYAYDGSRVWRADIGVDSTQWKKNPNRWTRGNKKCFIR